MGRAAGDSGPFLLPSIRNSQAIALARNAKKTGQKCDFGLPLLGARGRAGKRGNAMNVRMALTGGAIAAALALAACHKSDATATNEVNAATELSNLTDTNANDESMDEGMGNQAAINAG
jgi:hypothetical protein